MYQAPQMFFYDDSPPTSPVERRGVPKVQISEVPRLDIMEHKMEHRRWKSVPEKKHTNYAAPFSYEYTIEDGRLAGLAEYHPDQDFLHYSSSPGTSRTASRSGSTRTSRDISARPSLEVRKSTSSQISQPSQGLRPPPSPKKTEVLKRALSLHNLKGRKSTEEKRSSPPSPHVRPDLEKFAASFGPNGPKHITSPIQSPPPHKFLGLFEEPRPAPRPPLRYPARIEKTPEPLREVKANTSVPLARKTEETKHDSFHEPIRSPKTPEKESFAAPGTAITTPVRVETQPAQQTPPPKPILRRKTSKFIEHLDNAQIMAESPKKASERLPPVPTFLPPFDFQLPSPPPPAGKLPQPVRNFPMARAMTVKAQAPPRLWQQNIVRKRSASNMKSLPPVPGPLPKRSMSTRTRPTPKMADVCMAQIKPVMLGPIVASGHARMVSC